MVLVVVVVVVSEDLWAEEVVSEEIVVVSEVAVEEDTMADVLVAVVSEVETVEIEVASVEEIVVVAVDSEAEIEETEEDSEVVKEVVSAVDVVAVVPEAVEMLTWSSERMTGHVINVETVISHSDGSVINARHHAQMEDHQEVVNAAAEVVHQEETDTDLIKPSSQSPNNFILIQPQPIQLIRSL